MVSVRVMPVHQCHRAFGGIAFSPGVFVHLGPVSLILDEQSVIVWCLNHQESFWSVILLSVLEGFIDVTHSHEVHLSL